MTIWTAVYCGLRSGPLFCDMGMTRRQQKRRQGSQLAALSPGPRSALPARESRGVSLARAIATAPRVTGREPGKSDSHSFRPGGDSCMLLPTLHVRSREDPPPRSLNPRDPVPNLPLSFPQQISASAWQRLLCGSSLPGLCVSQRQPVSRRGRRRPAAARPGASGAAGRRSSNSGPIHKPPGGLPDAAQDTRLNLDLR